MQYEYKTKGTCSRAILFDIENNKVKNVQFIGGCNGNLKGIGSLVEGMDVDEVIARVNAMDFDRTNELMRCLLGAKPSCALVSRGADNIELF